MANKAVGLVLILSVLMDYSGGLEGTLIGVECCPRMSKNT